MLSMWIEVPVRTKRDSKSCGNTNEVVQVPAAAGLSF